MKQTILIMVLFLTCMQAGAAESPADLVEAAVTTALNSMQTGAVLVPGSMRSPNLSLRGDPTQVVIDKLTISRSGHLDARVRCVPIRRCLPFAVSAEVVGQKSAAVWVRCHANASGGELRESAARTHIKARILKLGDLVLFVREHDGIRTRIQAITLNNASIGDTVRVRAVDGKHEIMRGRVCAEHIVREDS